ncbi:hypothetical protein M0R45_008599 [Rubus argutus]|uniref:Glutamine amidotransferase domain-containing protein n=1 Tax=Rubus argutus TaxID=59490 RepID=A0AAW1Y1T4_RUBAR
MGGKKFGVLLCAEDSDFVKKMYGGYLGFLSKCWRRKARLGTSTAWPAASFPRMTRLLTLLTKLDSLKKKVLGICFGHQILSRALGGKSGRAITGWDIGIRTVHLSSSSKAFSSLKIPALLSIYEIHRDEVWELPPKAELIAWSEKTGVEMFKYGDHIMGIQGHPEYTKDILLNLIDHLVKLDYILESETEELKAKVLAREPDREVWRRLCLNFLKGDL